MSVPVLSLHSTSSSQVIRELDREYSSFVAPVFCNMYPSSLIERCIVNISNPILNMFLKMA